MAGSSLAGNSNLFRAYIGALYKGVRFTDVPINPKTKVDFLLSFAIDYTTGSSNPTPTDGNFNTFWDSANLSPQDVLSIKKRYPNVRVGLSIGGDSVKGQNAYFDPANPANPSSWVSNAFSSLKKIIQEYHLDGIDINYEHFKTDPNTFAECIGSLLTKLKGSKLIKHASIAPFASSQVKDHYLELWKRYGHKIDYVNFQFYASGNKNVEQFINDYQTQKNNYSGGKILTSYISDGSVGLGPQKGFFDACEKLKSLGELYGIFVWSADGSKALDFQYERRAQELLASN